MYVFIYILVFFCLFLNTTQSFSQKKYSEDYENASFGQWQHNDNWVLDEKGQVSGEYSIRHNVFGKGGESFICRSISETVINEGDISWNFTIKTGNFDPVGSERFCFFLAADSEYYLSVNGYAIGVNVDGEGNYLSLFRLVDGKPEKKIIKTDLRWGRNTTVEIDIFRSNKGRWILKYRKRGNADWSEEYSADYHDTALRFSYVGLLYRYSSTQGGQLWFDDFAMNIGYSPPYITYEYAALENEVLISEVLFNPKVGESEFIEIYNNSGSYIDLSRMFFAKRNDILELKQVCKITEYEFLIAPGEYLAITENSFSVINSYMVECNECIIEVEEIPTLNNNKGRVVLLNENMLVIDELFYTDDMHHALISDTKGVSLERKSFGNATNEPGNWHSASSETGYATPGYINSSFGNGIDATSNVTVSPKIFSPNDDGYNDRLDIKISTGEVGWIANIRVFSSEGYEICKLTRNSLIAPDEIIEWDGCDENSQKQNLGIYIIVVELFHPSGRKKLFKYPCVITDKLE